MIQLSSSEFDPQGHWHQPIIDAAFWPVAQDLDLFDQNGYDLTQLEQLYAAVNDARPRQHRQHRQALKQPWFTQPPEIEGAVLNHSLLFERKSYAGAALAQLTQWAQDLPLVHKLICMRSKWGLDFSMDWVDRAGNAFEVLHWEWDSFDYEEISNVKQQIEPILQNIDWQQAGQSILRHRHQWQHLDFFEQSDWKCKYFGVPRERFKMVAWILNDPDLNNQPTQYHQSPLTSCSYTV